MSADLTYDGYKLVALKNIVGPGDVKRRQATQDVKDLAESIRELGDEPMHAITARKTKRGWEIIAGRDRYSALLLLKAQRTWVHVVTHATPMGLVRAEAHENLRRRRDDRGALLAALDKAEAAITGQASGKGDDEPQRGRPATPRGEARRIIAESSGRSVEAVRKAEARAREREEGAEERAAGVTPPSSSPPPPIDTRGLPLPGHMAPVAALVKTLGKLDQQLRQAKATTSDLSMYPELPPGVVEGIQRSLAEATARLRHETPAHLCPKCDGKSQPITGLFCGLCQERGWVTQAQLDAAPKDRTIGEAIAERKRQIPPIKAGVTYTTDERGDVERDEEVFEGGGRP